MPAAVAVPIAAAVIAAGATVYSVNQQKQMAEKQANDQAELERQREKAAQTALPNTAELGASVAQGQRQAQSAGGTISSDPAKNAQAGQLGSAVTTGSRTLLGA